MLTNCLKIMAVFSKEMHLCPPADGRVQLRLTGELLRPPPPRPTSFRLNELQGGPGTWGPGDCHVHRRRGQQDLATTVWPHR